MSKNKENYFTVTEVNVMKMLIRCFRYAITRDNHLEPYSTIKEVAGYIDKSRQYKDHWKETFLREAQYSQSDLLKMSEENSNLVLRFMRALKDTTGKSISEQLGFSEVQ